MKKWYMFLGLMVSFFCSSMVEAQTEPSDRPGVVWHNTRPIRTDSEMTSDASKCADKKEVRQRLDCFERELATVDLANVNARTALINDTEWLIASFAEHLNEYDHQTLKDLSRVASKLAEIGAAFQVKEGSGGRPGVPDMTGQEMRDRLDQVLELKKRIDELEQRQSNVHVGAGGLLAFVGDDRGEHAVPMGQLVFHLEPTSRKSHIMVSGAIGSSTDDRSGLSAAARYHIGYMVGIPEFHLGIGGLHLVELGVGKEHTQQMTHQGMLTLLWRPATWLNLESGAGGGICSVRGVGRWERCGGFVLSLALFLP